MARSFMLSFCLGPPNERTLPAQMPPKPTPEVTMFDPLAKDKAQPDSSTGNISGHLYPSTAGTTEGIGLWKTINTVME